MLSILLEPWPWWIGGPLIGLLVIIFVFVENKALGISSSYPYICSKIAPLKLNYLTQAQKGWQFYFALGLISAGIVISLSLKEYQIAINTDMNILLGDMGYKINKGFTP